jgi:type I restriction enzyme R subunit
VGGRGRRDRAHLLRKRLAKLDLPEELKPRLDAEFEEVSEGEEIERKERLKTK